MNADVMRVLRRELRTRPDQFVAALTRMTACLQSCAIQHQHDPRARWILIMSGRMYVAVRDRPKAAIAYMCDPYAAYVIHRTLSNMYPELPEPTLPPKVEI